MCLGRASVLRPSPTRMASTAAMLPERVAAVRTKILRVMPFQPVGGRGSLSGRILRRRRSAGAARGSAVAGSDCAWPRGWRRCVAGWATGGWSAARVTVPLRLKFWSSRGPIASVAGESLFGGVSWANAVIGASESTPASNTYPKRETAFICSRSARDSRRFPRRDRHMPAVRASFKHSVDEPTRNRAA